MPLREYRCPWCGTVKEQLEHAGLTYGVPLCSGADHTEVTMERIQFSKTGAPNLVGSGFFKNDYKDKP